MEYDIYVTADICGQADHSSVYIKVIRIFSHSPTLHFSIKETIIFDVTLCYNVVQCMSSDFIAP